MRTKADKSDKQTQTKAEHTRDKQNRTKCRLEP